MLLHILRQCTEWRVCWKQQRIALYFKALCCISTLCTVSFAATIAARSRGFTQFVGAWTNKSLQKWPANNLQNKHRSARNRNGRNNCYFHWNWRLMHLQRILSYCLLAHGQYLMQNISENKMIAENGRGQNFLELEIRCFNVNSLIAMVIYLPTFAKAIKGGLFVRHAILLWRWNSHKMAFRWFFCNPSFVFVVFNVTFNSYVTWAIHQCHICAQWH